MNRIIKSVNIPASLVEGASEATETIRKSLREGKAISFSSLYRNDDVKRQLKLDQHNKCAYCERFLNGDYGAVEHYRPKGGYQQSLKDSLHQPGYYWLAYDWSNLLYSCDRCNTSYKRNLFPLADESKRNIDGEDISQEDPLIINSSVEDPGNHIEFHQYVVCPKQIRDKEDLKGKTTIEIFHLNTDMELVNRRMVAWGQYIRALGMLRIGQTLSAKNIPEGKALVDIAKQSLDDITSEDSEFTGMFRYQK